MLSLSLVQRWLVPVADLLSGGRPAHAVRRAPILSQPNAGLAGGLGLVAVPLFTSLSCTRWASVQHTAWAHRAETAL